MAEDLRTQRKGQILAVKDLPTLPPVLDQVSRLVEDPESSTDQIAKVIGMDQVLSAKILKMVNSPIYGFPGRISSIQHALVLLGFNVIRGVIISTSVFDVMNQSMAGMWEHSVGAATAARTIAERAGFKDPEEFAVAGLLHDLGKVVAAVQMQGLKDELDALVRQEDLTYFEAERRVLGFSHDMIGAWLAGHWNLPVNIKDALSHHHKPLLARFYPQYASVAHVADFCVRLLEFGDGGDQGVPRLEKGALKLLGLDGRALLACVQDLEDRLVDVAGFNFGGAS